MNSSFDTPILLLIFNRPEATAKVFEAIRARRPSRLYIAADGPRASKPQEKSLCDEARRVVSSIDWPCEVELLFRDSNLGCRMAVSSAISWFFEREPEGIIIEDDCLPSLDFFRFCERLLHRYRDDRRVMHIGGSNFQNGVRRGEASYYYSRLPHIWGWASWRRAWASYDVSILDLEAFAASGAMNSLFPNCVIARDGFVKEFAATAKGLLDTWDHQWTYAVFKEGGLSIIPNANLVSNIGFSGTRVIDRRALAIPFEPLGEIVHPKFVFCDIDADEATCRMNFGKPSLPMRIADRIKRDFKKLLTLG